MDITELLFFTGFIILIGITLLKFYNILRSGEVYKIKTSIMLFVGFLMSYFLVFNLFMLNTSELVYLVIFRFSMLLLIPNLVFLIIEVIFNLRDAAKTGKKRNSLEFYKAGSMK